DRANHGRTGWHPPGCRRPSSLHRPAHRWPGTVTPRKKLICQQEELAREVLGVTSEIVRRGRLESLPYGTEMSGYSGSRLMGRGERVALAPRGNKHGFSGA